MKEIEHVFEAKRKQLRREIDVAESLLKDNLSSINVMEYVANSAKRVVPQSLEELVEDPKDAILKFDFVADRVLKHDHWLRQILKNAATLIRAYELFIDRR